MIQNMKLLICLGLLLCLKTFAGDPQTNSSASSAGSAILQTRTNNVPQFAEVVKRYFSQWDANGDGILSNDEIDKAVMNPDFHDEVAAAIAAIKVVVRGGRYDLPPLTKEYLTASPLRETGVTADLTTQSVDAAPGKVNRRPAFQPRFRAFLLRLHRTSRELFPQSLPEMTACHQGPLGDCYLISVVGAMVHRDPAAVKALFTPAADGTTKIAFGNGHNVEVKPLTDAEIAISSSAGTNGLWLATLENAYGKANNNPASEKAAAQLDTDVIAHGGKPRVVINTIEGHQTRSYSFVRHRSDTNDLQFPNELGKAIIDALNAHQIVAAVTPTNTVLPPGVNGKHCYAILGYDADRKVVHLWNPHGNRFTPKGQDSRQHGYTTLNGEFDMPLQDMIQVFSTVIIETPTLVETKPSARLNPENVSARLDPALNNRDRDLPNLPVHSVYAVGTSSTSQ